MTDRAIQAGDLVVLVRSPCHCCDRHLGLILRVQEIKYSPGECECHTVHPSALVAIVKGMNWFGGWPVLGLKRIPPLSELESTQEKLEQPV